MAAKVSQLDAILDLLERGFIPHEPYVDSKTRILCVHTECGKEVYVWPNNVRRGMQCRYCAGDRTPAQMQEEAEGYGFTFLEPCLNSAEAFRARHSVCGQEVKIRMVHVRRGVGCGYCRGRRTPEQLRAEFLSHGLTPTETVTSAERPCAVVHDDCGATISISLKSIRKGASVCSCLVRRAQTPEEYDAELTERGFAPISPGLVINSNAPVMVVHSTCGQTVRVRLTNLRAGVGCGYCAGYRRGEQLKSELLELGYVALELPVSVTRATEATHIVCGQKVMVRVSSLRTGSGCPYCYGHRTPAQIREEFISFGFTPIGEVKTVEGFIECRHAVCGQVVVARLSSVRSGSVKACSYCAGRRSPEQRRAEVMSFGYTPLEEIRSTQKPFTAVHDACGNVTKVYIKHLRAGVQRCQHCYERCHVNSRRKCPKPCTCSMVNEALVAEVTEHRFTPLADIINSRVAVSMRHEDCGDVVGVSVSNLRRSWEKNLTGCKHCSKTCPTTCPCSVRKNAAA